MPSLHKKGTQCGRAEPAKDLYPQKGYPAWTRRARRGLLSTKRVPSVDAQSPQRTSVHKKGIQRGRAEPAEDFSPQKGSPVWTHRAYRGLLSTNEAHSVEEWASFDF